MQTFSIKKNVIRDLSEKRGRGRPVKAQPESPGKPVKKAATAAKEAAKKPRAGSKAAEKAKKTK